MVIPTLVVSDPPHGEVDLDAAAELLELDLFATRLKVVFAAPEVMSASGPEEAAEFYAVLTKAGFNASVVDGAALVELPWPDPLSSLTFDVSHLHATVRGENITIPYDARVVGVHCRPPAERSMERTVALDRAMASAHGPTIAQAIERKSVLDLYFRDEGALRRVTIVPDLLEADAEGVIKELGRRMECLELDTRLVGVRPRAPFTSGAGFKGPERRRYSFGTAMLHEVLGSIAPELRAATQYEFGSRLAYALNPV